MEAQVQNATLATRKLLAGIITPTPPAFFQLSPNFLRIFLIRFALPHTMNSTSTQTFSSAHVYHDHSIQG